MSDRLKDRIAIVTGGAQGIGRAITQRLMDAGATVIVGDLKRPDSGAQDWYLLDVADESSVVAFYEAVIAKHPGIDVLVNNAGIEFERTITEQTGEDWDRMMAVNLKGPFLMSKHGLSHLTNRGGGAIINIGSIEGIGSNPNHSAYSSSKGGVHGLTKALAVELGPQNIRCNAVAPGWIDTDLNKTYVDSHPDRELVYAELTKLHPVGHIGDPRDVGDAVVWLASDESRFVTGQIITLDGGRCVKLPLPGIFGR